MIVSQEVHKQALKRKYIINFQILAVEIMESLSIKMCEKNIFERKFMNMLYRMLKTLNNLCRMNVTLL